MVKLPTIFTTFETFRNCNSGESIIIGWITEGVIDYEQRRHDRVSNANRQPEKVTFGKNDRLESYFFACVQANIQLVQADLSFG